MIYFDMDGVLAELDPALLMLCGPSLPPRGERTAEETRLMWRRVAETPGFFSSLSPIRGSLEMFHIARAHFGAEQVAILTGVPSDVPDAARDKRIWCARHLGSVTVHTVLSDEKHLRCTGRQDVLIDDLERNAEAWRKAGGTAILFESPDQALAEMGLPWPQGRDRGPF